MDWLQQLWVGNEWYERIYLVAGAACGLSLVLFLLFLAPYIQVSEKINREYRRLCSQHLFIGFRAKKQNELYSKAKLQVGSRDGKYVYYQFGEFAKGVSIISFGIAFWFFTGSFLYDNVIHVPATSEHSPASTGDAGYEGVYDDQYETYDEGNAIMEDDHIHHVEPHWVEGYERSDGTEVDSYWRGGDEGYERSDPDGDVTNNLNYDSSGDAASILDIFN